ncbi:MAG: hypothetical protein R6V55_08915 [Desulfovermiculus sp.]
MGAVIFIEGGGDSKDLHLECRKAFRMLLEKTGFSGRMPRLVACGGRDDAYDDFRTSHEKSSPGEYIVMLECLSRKISFISLGFLFIQA